MAPNTRRNFLTGAAALAAASATSTASGASAVTEHHWGDIRLAVATYSLRAFSREQAISIVRRLGIKYVNVKSFHMPYYLSKEDLKAARADFEKAGLEIVSGGNVSLQSADEGFIRRHLEYAKNAGMPTVVCAPTTTNLKLVEKHARELDLKIAIHNHGPEDKHFPNGASVLKYVNDMDPRMGLCYDIGHACRTGADVVEELEAAGDRLHDIHIKDLTDFSDRGSQVIVGKGKIPVADIFMALKKMRYKGVVGLEYEIDVAAPEAGMDASISYMRGLLDGQASVS
ncbi:MAG: sugar phosphate isomerase/epimerase [Acidobacteria bacterium]|nr:sugar phosphate isomerase/epimerase [Acidobacteriota bacterium]